jgi:hypothetical protein
MFIIVALLHIISPECVVLEIKKEIDEQIILKTGL